MARSSPFVRESKRLPTLRLVAAFCTCLVVSCDRSPEESNLVSNASVAPSPQAQSDARPAIALRSNEEVRKFVKAAHDRGGPLTEADIAALSDAARHDVPAAYFALYHHHSISGDPNEGEQWFQMALNKNEPNVHVLVASREMTRADSEEDINKRRELLESAQRHYRVGLRSAVDLTVESPESVRANLRKIEELLAAG